MNQISHMLHIQRSLSLKTIFTVNLVNKVRVSTAKQQIHYVLIMQPKLRYVIHIDNPNQLIKLIFLL